jgi:competence CoiA-like predicted nuclease
MSHSPSPFAPCCSFLGEGVQNSAQAALQWTGNPPSSTSLVPGITVVHHHSLHSFLQQYATSFSFSMSLLYWGLFISLCPLLVSLFIPSYKFHDINLSKAALTKSQISLNIWYCFLHHQKKILQYNLKIMNISSAIPTFFSSDINYFITHLFEQLSRSPNMVGFSLLWSFDKNPFLFLACT